MKKLHLNARSRDVVFRSLVAFAMLFGIVILQTSFLPGLDLFGAIPDLALVFVVGIAFFDGFRIGILNGIGAGLLIYFLGGMGAALPILFYSFCGGGFGLASERILGRNFPSWCIYAISAIFLKAVWSLLVCFWLSAAPRLGAALTESILPEAIGTFLLFLFLWYPIKRVSKLLKRKSEIS